MNPEDPNISTQSTPPIVPVQPVVVETEKKPFFAKLFRTKTSSFFSLVLLGIIVQFVFSRFTYAGVFLGPGLLILGAIVATLLRLTGHTTESKNVVKAIGTLILVGIVLAIIGFGLCLLLIGSWN